MSRYLRNLALAAPTVLILAWAAVPTFAYPGDVFVTTSPASPRQAPATGGSGGGHSVSHDGAALYTVSLPVPAGRNGLEPSLSLSYSSRNPVRGGVAAGWQLPIPSIAVDTSQGRLGRRLYRSSLTGGRLVRVKEPGVAPGTEAYRGEHDGAYTRYERIVDGRLTRWRALATDGTIYHLAMFAMRGPESLTTSSSNRAKI